MARAASFLLLNDTKSSFAIEGERPSNARAARWGQAIAEAGQRTPDRAELERLQRIVIGDARFVRLGLRREGGFVGRRDRTDGTPLPDHVSARAQDLPGLVDGIAAYCARAPAGGLDPVVAAAAATTGSSMSIRSTTGTAASTAGSSTMCWRWRVTRRRVSCSRSAPPS